MCSAYTGGRKYWIRNLSKVLGLKRWGILVFRWLSVKFTLNICVIDSVDTNVSVKTTHICQGGWSDDWTGEKVWAKKMVHHRATFTWTYWKAMSGKVKLGSFIFSSECWGFPMIPPLISCIYRFETLKHFYEGNWWDFFELSRSCMLHSPCAWLISCELLSHPEIFAANTTRMGGNSFIVS